MIFAPRLCVVLPVLGALALSACSGDDGSFGSGSPGVVAGCPSARIATRQADLIEGPLARGQLGDLVLENTELRSIIQKPGRNWFQIAQFGGNIIDAVPKAADGSLAAQDQYEEAALGTNIESSPNYQTVEVIEAGRRGENGECVPAVIRATGPDDLLDFVNGSSAIRDLGFMFPDSADDVDLPVTIITDYTLAPGARAVRMDTRLVNDSDSALDIYLVEYLNGSGEVEMFQHGYGFGEPLITAPCEECRYAVYAGHEGGSGVSYGILHDFATTTSLSISGVTVLVYGTDALLLAAGGSDLAPPPFTIPAGGETQFTRHFAVGTGDVASVLGIRYGLAGIEVGEVTGRVTDANGPVVGAEVSVISENNTFEPALIPNFAGLPIGSNLVPRGPETIVVSQFRTDANGNYGGQLPLGDYELRINVPGRLAPEPAQAAITVAADAPVRQDFLAPLPARLQVRVSDSRGNPVAGKVQLIGTDTSPDAGEPQNSETIFQGPLSPILSQAANLSLNTGIFGDGGADPLPNGIVLAEFAVTGQRDQGPATVGDTGILDIEPGDYRLVVSHGNRYSLFSAPVSLSAGQLRTVNATVARVVDTPGQLYGDFHVHSFDSADAEVTERQRVATYMAEDVDFFTPSDHGMRVDFAPILAAMGFTDRIATAPSAENTTFDYGHINAWPVLIDRSPARNDEPSQSPDAKTSQGSIDWGRPAPPGTDFPSQGSYGLAPAEIFADAKNEPFTPGENVVVQINHVETHFGATGLQIDTGVAPPQSARDPASRRLDPALGNLYDETSGYDALELWIGADGLEQLEHFPEQNIGDWFNLINQDIVKTFVANSDTHTRRLTSLSTRNLIPLPSGLMIDGRPDFAAISASPHRIADHVRQGRSIGTNSLWLNLVATNNVAQQAGMDPELEFGLRSAPLPVAAGTNVDLNLQIRSPLWAEYDRILVYSNTVTQPRDEDGVPRYRPCAPQLQLELGRDFTRQIVPAVVVEDASFNRFDTNLSISLAEPGEDFWVVVLVEGTDGVSRPLWPVVPDDFSNNDADPLNASTEDRGIPALAMTNPLFFDVGGDGYTAPGLRFCEPEDDGSLLGQGIVPSPLR